MVILMLDEQIKRYLDFARRGIENEEWLYTSLALDMLELYCHENNIDVPEDVAILRKKLYESYLPHGIAFVKSYLENGMYTHAKFELVRILECAEKANEKLPIDVKRIVEDVERKLKRHSEESIIFPEFKRFYSVE